VNSQIASLKQYCNSLTSYSRRKTIEVKIGDVAMGGDNPIRIQSMTTIDTMDTAGSVEQSIRMIQAGCEYVRITAPSIKEAQNLEVIKKELRRRGYNAPLVADIHFTPNAAELAARLVEKVRINPGNYADKKDSRRSITRKLLISQSWTAYVKNSFRWSGFVKSTVQPCALVQIMAPFPIVS
jgi:(E)-4-hydroxy-3-methylbut-2-enyl-diphosphate synthase